MFLRPSSVVSGAMATPTPTPTTTMTMTPTTTTRRRRGRRIFARRSARELLLAAVGTIAFAATVLNQYRLAWGTTTTTSTRTSSSSSSSSSWWWWWWRYHGDHEGDSDSSSTEAIQQEIRSILRYKGGGGGGGAAFDRAQQLQGSPVLRAAAPGTEHVDDAANGSDEDQNHDGNPRNGESFSACLLWMDDNFRLTEWVAYHYYMMNLRYVVVAVDPRSRTDPWDALDKWKARMTIEVWTHDANFTDLNFAIQEGDSPRRKTKRLIQRQGAFYQACAMHLKALNRTWTSFHDSDEFLVVTPQANVSQQSIARRPGAVLRIVQKYGRHQPQRAPSSPPPPGFNHVPANASLPALNGTTPGDDNNNNNNNDNADDPRNWVRWFSSKPCMTIPRVLFSAVPSRPEDVTNNVPSIVEAHQFATLAYRYQATPTKGDTDGAAKSIVDLSRLPWDADRFSKGGSAHRPFKNDTVCAHQFPPTGVLPLVIHHYLGSWEAFSFRDDARKGGLRTREKWEERSALQGGGINDGARPWIRGVVRMVGNDAAVELLKGAGLPPGYQKSDNETLEWASRKPELLANANRN
jgi:hypothetical protein